MAETTAGHLIAAEACSKPLSGGGSLQQLPFRERLMMGAPDQHGTPETIGRQAALMLVEEISRGGAVASMHQVFSAACKAA